MSPPERTAPAPEVVADHFVRQYYGGVVVNKGADLIRFYTEESTFTCATAKEAERVSGIAAIKAKIQQLGLEGADRVDLGGDIDVKPTGGGGVLIKVTGWITISGMNPRQFCQTFVLSREHRFTDRRNYFVRDEIFRFIDGPDVVQIQAENARKRQAPWPKTVAEIMSHKERRAMNKASKKKEKAEKASNGEEASRKEHRAMKKAFKKKKNESRACRPSDDLFPAGAPSVKPPRGRSRTRKSPVSLGKPVASGTRTQKRGAKPGSVAWEEAFSRAVGAVSKVDADACARKLSNPRLRKSGSEPRYVGRSPPQVPETCRRRQTRSFFGAAATDSVASYQSEDEGAGREERQRSSWSPVSSSSGRMASMKVHSKDEASEKAENDYGASDCGEGKSAQNMTASVFGDIASACGEKQEGHGASEVPARSEKRSMTVSTIQTASPESRKVSVESTHPTVGAEDRSNGNADDSRRSSWTPREKQVEDADLAYEGRVSDDDEDDVYEEAGGAGSEGVKPPMPVQESRACRPSGDLFPAGAPSVKPPRGRSRTRKSPVSLGKPVASGTRTQKRGAKPGSVAWEEAFSRAVGAVSKVDADACARKLSNPRLRKSGSEPRYVGRSPPQVPETCRRRQTRSFFGAAATDSVASYQSEDEGAGREERQRSSWSPVSSSSGRMASMKVHSKDEASEKAENDYGASDCGEGKSAQNMTVSVFGDIASACGEKQEGHGASEAPARSEKRSMTVSTIQTASPESRKVSVESTHPTVGAEDRSNGNADDSRRSSWMPREEQVEDADLAYEGSVSDDDEDDVYEEAGGAGSEGVKPPLPVQDNGQRELEMEDEAGRISADGTYSDRGMPMPATSSPRPVVGYSLARLGKGIKLLSWSLIILVAVCGSILFLDCRLCPCSRGNVLHPGDTALVPGECIAGANGSRHFGWLPWVSWKPTLFVGDSGEMIATRPDGKRITLWEGGMTKRNGFLSRVFSAPARSRLEARLHRLRRRGGHVRFSEVGDLYVADSTGRIVWSLAEEVEREGERQKMGEAKGLGGLENDILLVL